MSGDTLWLQTRQGTTAFALSEVTRVQVERHRWGARRLLTFLGIGAAVTSAGMYGACTQVSEGCAAVVPAMVLSWGLVGGIGAFAVASSRYESIPPNQRGLEPYARYPQGWPRDVDRKPTGAHTSSSRPN